MRSVGPTGSEHRLRVLFRDAEVSLGQPARTTLADIADWVGSIGAIEERTTFAIKIVSMPVRPVVCAAE